MRVLALAEFDAAGVLAGHRRTMRALGHDYRLAVRDVYRPERAELDWRHREGRA